MIPWCEPGLHRQVWGHAVPRGQGVGGVFTAGAAGMQAAVGGRCPDSASDHGQGVLTAGLEERE